MKNDRDFRIESADTNERYEGLRALWCEVFNDEPDFVNGMYEAFGANPDEGVYASEEIRGYAVLDAKDEVISALTCFLSGTYEGRPVYTSYAICTKDNMRGLGLAGRLVEHVRDIVLDAGGISLISPAEPSLIDFYGAHGYEPHFYAIQNHALLDDEELFEFDEEDDEYEKFKPEFEMKALDAASYNKYREAFLSVRPHVELSDAFMKLIYEESMQPDGSSGLFSINGGDAICALAEHPSGMPMIAELILNPVLSELSMEIDSEIARMIALRLGTDAVLYRTPGPGACQSMTAGLKAESLFDEDDEEAEMAYNYTCYEAYYGFPID
jgi:GNAT superfamily N-acetyltransferase